MCASVSWSNQATFTHKDSGETDTARNVEFYRFKDGEYSAEQMRAGNQ